MYQGFPCGSYENPISTFTALSEGCNNFLQTFGTLTTRRQKSMLIGINIMTGNEHLGVWAVICQ